MQPKAEWVANIWCIGRKLQQSFIRWSQNYSFKTGKPVVKISPKVKCNISNYIVFTFFLSCIILFFWVFFIDVCRPLLYRDFYGVCNHMSCSLKNMISYDNYYVHLCFLQIIRNVIIAREHQDESLAFWGIPFQTEQGKVSLLSCEWPFSKWESCGWFSTMCSCSYENCLRKVMDTDKHVFTCKVYSFVIKKKLIYL